LIRTVARQIADNPEAVPRACQRHDDDDRGALRLLDCPQQS